MEAFLQRFLMIESGYYTVSYNNRTYGMTVEVSDDTRRRKLFAEELGGDDHISLNLYLLKGKAPLLKPCEMPAQKVIDFVNDFTMHPRQTRA